MSNLVTESTTLGYRPSKTTVEMSILVLSELDLEDFEDSLVISVRLRRLHPLFCIDDSFFVSNLVHQYA